MIEVSHLVKYFGRRPAVRDVSFNVPSGAVLGFLGPNGAGKTTTMRMITGYLSPTSGTVRVGGVDVQEHPVATRKMIGYLPENVPLYGEMTVESFLNFIAEIRGFRGRARNERVQAVLAQCFLEPVRHQAIETLSKGYRQRTGFAQAILHDPPVLILDEPTEGLDPNQKHVVRRMISHMGRDKVIIVSTHILEEVEAMCSRVLIISKGELAADSTPAELKQRSEYVNAVRLEMTGTAEEARALFESAAGIARIEELGAGNGRVRLRLFAQEKKPILEDVLTLARRRGLAVANVQTEDGRLDDVFRQLTATADVTAQAQSEE